MNFSSNMTRCCRFSSRWDCDDEMLFKYLSIRHLFLNLEHVFSIKMIVCFRNRRCDFFSACWCSVWNSIRIDCGGAKNTSTNETRRQCDSRVDFTSINEQINDFIQREPHSLMRRHDRMHQWAMSRRDV